MDETIKDISVLSRQVMKLIFIKSQNDLNKFDLYPGQERVLYYLMREDGLSQKELCEKLNVKPSTMAVMLKRMESTGLFERVQDKNDKRITRIFLTHKGKDIHKDVMKVHGTLAHICFKDISEEEKIIFKRILMQIKSNLKKEINEKDVQDFNCMFKKKI